MMKSKKAHSVTPISFSLQLKEKKPPLQNLKMDEKLLDLEENKQKKFSNEIKNKTNDLADKLAIAAKERLSKEKELQQQRRKKAALFLKMIKDKEKESTSMNVDSKYGPTLPKSSKTDAITPPLSPTTKAITSPQASPEHIISSSLRSTSPLSEHPLSKSELTCSKSCKAIKKGECLPFVVSDEPLKKSRRHRRRSEERYNKSRSRSRTRSRSRSRSKSKSRPKSKSSKSSKSKRSSRSRSNS